MKSASDCNGWTLVSPTQYLRAADLNVWPSRLAKGKASKGPVPVHPLLAQFMLLWKQKTTLFTCW
jgi:hypothetical protein